MSEPGEEDNFGDEEEECEEDEIGAFGTNEGNLEALADRALTQLNDETAKDIDVNDYPELEELIMIMSDDKVPARSCHVIRDNRF